jgi:uncharacterized protein with PIN domain
MRLLADATLGRLAKWLRILGYDTAYQAEPDEFAVLRLARAEGRLLLTRNRALAAHPGMRALLITSDELDNQLRQVRDVIGFPPEEAQSRCPVCNEPLVDADSELVAARVPPYVRRTHMRFSLCVSCDQVYWRGTHWQRMQALITGLRDKAGSDTIRPFSQV